MEKFKVLFVDDDFVIIETLKRSLHRLCPKGKFIFTSDPYEVLSLVENESPDILVTDIQMPGKSGIEVLEEVAVTYPNILRYSLSGGGGQEVNMRIIELVDGAFSKPCNSQDIVSKLEKVYCKEEGFQISRNGPLRCSSECLEQVKEIIQNGKGGLEQVLLQDGIMALKALQTVEMFVEEKLDSLSEKLTQANTSLFFDICTGTKLFSPFSLDEIQRWKLENFWKENLEIAKLSKYVAFDYTNDENIADEAYFAGLFHRIGLLFIISDYPEKYQKVLKELEDKENSNVLEVEEGLLGINQQKVSGYIVSLWLGIPSLTRAIRYYLTPMKAGDNQVFDSLTALHIGHAICSGCEGDLDYLKSFGLDKKMIQWKSFLSDDPND